MKPRGTAQGAPMRAPLTAVSAFQRRASAHFLRRPRTGKIATSVITRAYAEKAAQKRRPSLARCSPASPSLADINVAGFFWLGPSGSRSITLISSSGAVRARPRVRSTNRSVQLHPSAKIFRHMHIIVSRGTVDERNDGAAPCEGTRWRQPKSICIKERKK